MDVKQTISSIIASHKAIPLVNKPTDITEPSELVAERTGTAKVFDLGNGRRQAKIHGCPIHFKDTDGSFKSIDPTVKRKPLADPLQRYQYEVKSGVYHAHFDKNKPWNYRLETGDSWVEYEALFDESDSLGINIETSKIGVKETITLNAPTKLSWRVTRSGSGIITPPPTATDANDKNVSVKVSQHGDILTYELDITGAVFPITLDPTSIVATNDGYLMGTNATYTTARNASAAGYSGMTYIYAGQQHGSDNNYYMWRSFASFVIPDMATLTAASLFMDGSTDQSTARDFDVYIHTSTYSNPLAVGDWDLFDGHQASGAYNGTVLIETWNTAVDYSADWNEFVFNADGLAAILAKKNDTFKMAILSEHDYNNSAPTPNPPNNVNEYIRFISSGGTGEDPYLSITFTPPQAKPPLFMSTYRRRRT